MKRLEFCPYCGRRLWEQEMRSYCNDLKYGCGLMFGDFGYFEDGDDMMVWVSDGKAWNKVPEGVLLVVEGR